MNNQKLKSPQRTVMEKMRGTKVTCKMTTSEHKSATKEMNVMKSPRGNCENRKKIKSPKNTHQ